MRSSQPLATVAVIMDGLQLESPAPGMRHPIGWIRSHPAAADLMFAGLVTAITVGFHLLDLDPTDEFRSPTWWTPLVVVAAVFPVAWRRSHPVESTLFVVGAQIVVALADVEGTRFIGVVIVLYSLGAHAEGPRRRRCVIAVSVSIALLFVAGLSVSELDVGTFLSSTVVLVTAFVLGDNFRRRRDAAASLQERLERVEREREFVAQQRVTEERSRIARELHDIVAHSVSAMVIQAAAARRSLPTSISNAETALANIETTGRRTMDELRSVLGVLRRSQTETADAMEPSVPPPQPTLAGVTVLVEAMSDLPIALDVSGELTGLPAGVDLAGYRIVQEALTNVRRHAGPVSNVQVRLELRCDDVLISVLDDGRGASTRGDGEGHGVVGMRERVEAVRGAIDIGPRAGGGWRVSAHLPTGALFTAQSVPQREALT